MSQSRYLTAFLLSSLTFILFYFAFLSLGKIEKKLKADPPKVIKIAIISPPKKIVKPVPPVISPPTPMAIPTPIVPPVMVKKVEKKDPPKIIVKPKPKPKKIIKKKVIKKVKPKKVVKKKVIKKKIVPKKVVKKKIVKKKIIKKKVVKKKVIKRPIVKQPVIEKPVETYVETYVPPIVPYVAPPVYVAPQPVVRPVVTATPTPPPSHRVNNEQHKKAFLRNVRSKIIANKTYPKIAKRRHIEGSVKVRFDITKQGHVSNIRFVSGKSIFQKSIRSTLERTFPMGIPNEVRDELPISNVSVVLHFNIR